MEQLYRARFITTATWLYGQYYIEKNGEGVLVFITNNSFVDGIIHRQMRKSLLETFDKIYILDLHGNARKQETAPDGGKDENVFDIMAGISINIFIKTNKKKESELGKVFVRDLFGTRKLKYRFLNKHDLSQMSWNEIRPSLPNLEFIEIDYSNKKKYDKYFSG